MLTRAQAKQAHEAAAAPVQTRKRTRSIAGEVEPADKRARTTTADVAPATLARAGPLATTPINAPATTHPFGGIASGDLRVESINPAGQQPFEPTLGRAGNFEQRRRFVTPPGKQGAVIQQVTRSFQGVRRGPRSADGSGMTPDQIDQLVRSKDAEAHASHGNYFEGFVVPKSGDRTAMEDTFGLTSIASPEEAKRPSLKNTTSGRFTMRGQARFYEHPNPGQLLEKHGFRSRKEGTTPANTLPERPAAAHRSGKRSFDALTLDDISRDHPHSGEVTHDVVADWDTFARGGITTKLTLNGKEWSEPPRKKFRGK
ncbi:MAG: hypothetical protein ACJ768_06205 [Gaiellaceae bacterium]